MAVKRKSAWISNRYTLRPGYTVIIRVRESTGEVQAALEHKGKVIAKSSGFERTELAKLWALDTINAQ